MVKDEKSLGSGLIFVGLGAGLVLYSWLTLETGSALRMGPGYFPTAIGICLVIVGVCVLASMTAPSRVLFREWPWRQIVLVTAAIAIFAVGLDTIGFLASSLLMTFVTAIARKETPLWQAAVIAVAITLFCTAVFYWGLGIPFRLY